MDYYHADEIINYKTDIQTFFKKTIKRGVNLLIEQGDKINVEDRKIFTGRDKLEFMLNVSFHHHVGQGKYRHRCV